MQRPADLQACIDACHAAATAADRCAMACLAEPDPGAMARCIQLDLDAAQLCRLVASYLARDSENAKLLCEDCAEACRLAMSACLRMAQAPIDEAAMAAAGLPRSGEGAGARGH